MGGVFDVVRGGISVSWGIRSGTWPPAGFCSGRYYVVGARGIPLAWERIAISVYR